MSLKPGDTWAVDKMPTSFSTDKSVASSFARTYTHTGVEEGIILHMPVAKLKNSPSIRGASHYNNEYEVLVADYNWKVSKVTDEGGGINIYFE